MRPKTAPTLTNHATRSRRLAFADMQFSRELRSDVLAGDITLSVRLWKRARVKQGGRCRRAFGEIEVDGIELLPFSAIGWEDVLRAGEHDRESLRQRARTQGRSMRRRLCIESSSTRWSPETEGQGQLPRSNRLVGTTLAASYGAEGL